MNTTTIAAIIALLVIIGGGVYYNTMTPMSEQLMEKGDVMMKEGEQMMEKADVMMDKGGAMMEEGKKMQFTDESGKVMELEGGSGTEWVEKAPEGAMMSAGTYEAYAPEKIAKATDGDVVLFFRASWCPTCRTLDSDIKKNASSIPKGVTILDVDYDSSTALKQKYGVTQQHTLVQVAADGTLITKWTGGSTLSSVVSKIK